MSPEKRIAASRRGMANLHKRIIPLRDELEILQRAYLRLLKNKWKAEEKVVGVTYIPPGMTARKLAQEKKEIENKLNKISAEEAAEMLAALEARLGGN